MEPDGPRSSGRELYVAFLLVQAATGIALWIAWGTSDTAREWFALTDDNDAVMDSFVFADLLVGVGGSALGAWAIWTARRWAALVVAFTAGGLVYATLYLVAWVSFTGEGAACLGIMVPPSILTTWIATQVWRERRTTPAPDQRSVR